MKKMIKCKTCNAEIAASAKSCPSCGAKNKKPFYKKVSFWIIAIIIVIVVKGLAGGDSSNDSNQVQQNDNVAQTTNNNSEQSESTANETPAPVEEAKTKIKAGTYKVGTDLAAGEYLFVAKSMGYVECTSDSTGALESIVFNDNVAGHTYLTVNDGEYLKIQGGEMYPVAEAPSVIPADGLYKDGMYKVGQDIPAGEYKVVLTSSAMGYYEVAADSRHDLYSIVTNENVQADTYLTIQDGQYVKISGVEIQK